MRQGKLVYVIDDDRAVIRSLTMLLSIKGYEVESFDSAENFLHRLERPYPIGCVVADMRMHGMSGLQLLRKLTLIGCLLPVIIITGHGDIPLAVASLKAGAVDFMEKPYDQDQLLCAIDRALSMSQGVPEGLPHQLEVAARLRDSLSPRERQVMDLIVLGDPNKVIAYKLGISIRTVEIHRANVMDKMNVRTLADLIRLATLLDIMPLSS